MNYTSSNSNSTNANTNETMNHEGLPVFLPKDTTKTKDDGKLHRESFSILFAKENSGTSEPPPEIERSATFESEDSDDNDANAFAEDIEGGFAFDLEGGGAPKDGAPSVDLDLAANTPKKTTPWYNSVGANVSVAGIATTVCACYNGYAEVVSGTARGWFVAAMIGVPHYFTEKRFNTLESKVDNLQDGQKKINKRLDNLQGGQKTINERLDTVQGGQKTINERLDTVQGGQKTINERLDTITTLMQEQNKLLREQNNARE